MTAVEEIRQAAALMRARAMAATPRRWQALHGDESWAGDHVVADDEGHPLLSAGEGAAEDADHMASWHPPVALAVADWLENVAAWHDEGFGTCAEIDRTNYPDAIEDITANAWATARAYLGGAP